jgi:DNA-binding response OmpR family regulator
VVYDGEKAIRFIENAEKDESAPCPKLLLLDLNLPRKNGIEILERLRRSDKCGNIPVIVVTSSDSQQDRDDAARLGATRYFRKPHDFDEFVKLGEVVRQVLEEKRNA